MALRVKPRGVLHGAPMRALRAAIAGLAAAGALMLGLACLAAAGLAWGGRDDPRLDVLTHFAPIWLTGGLVSAIILLVLRLRWLRLVLALPGFLAAVAAGGLMWPEYTRPASPRAPADAPNQIKLIQFNTWGSNVDPERTGRWIADQDADVVILEESREPVVEAVLRHHPYVVTSRGQSVTILSRAKPAYPWAPWPRPRPHAALARARFGPLDGGFTVIGVHYTWPTDWFFQAGQADDTLYVVRRSERDRLILTGDFNSTPWSFSRRREDARLGMERRTRGLFTWPARNLPSGPRAFPFPLLPIDHVYAGPAWRTISVQRGPRLGSDHYPVVVRLALDPAYARPGEDRAWR
jgi:endonuclease/exonuclease/phosphatase (EEP) superfamily protein YafD